MPKLRVRLRLSPDVIVYFGQLERETGMAYLSLIKLYLWDCMRTQRRLDNERLHVIR